MAFEEAINATAATEAPWFVVPADDTTNMGLIVAQLILKRLKLLKMKYPEVSEARLRELEIYREVLRNDRVYGQPHEVGKAWIHANCFLKYQTP